MEKDRLMIWRLFTDSQFGLHAPIANRLLFWNGAEFRSYRGVGETKAAVR
jgi:hypothetical protein